MTMENILWALFGAVIPPILTWIASIVDKTGFIRFLVGVLGRFLKDPKARNKVENAYGVMLIEMGLELITFEKDDDTRLQKNIEDIKWKVEELKKIIQ